MKVNYSFIFLVLFSLYIGYFKYLLIMLICLLIHEVAHIILIKLFKVKITKFSLSLCGGLLEIDNHEFDNLSIIKKVIIYSSGIIVNLLLYILFNDSLFGKYNLILFLFNILPIYPLDGYNILKNLFKKVVVNNLSTISIVILLIISIYNYSLGLMLITFVLIIKNIKYYLIKDKLYLLKLINNMI